MTSKHTGSTTFKLETIAWRPPDHWERHSDSCYPRLGALGAVTGGAGTALTAHTAHIYFILYYKIKQTVPFKMKTSIRFSPDVFWNIIKIYKLNKLILNFSFNIILKSHLIYWTQNLKSTFVKSGPEGETDKVTYLLRETFPIHEKKNPLGISFESSWIMKRKRLDSFSNPSHFDR